MRLRSGAKYAATNLPKESAPESTLSKKTRSRQRVVKHEDEVEVGDSDTHDYHTHTDPVPGHSRSSESEKDTFGGSLDLTDHSSSSTMEEFSVSDTVSRLAGGSSLSDSCENIPEQESRGSTPERQNDHLADGDAPAHHQGNHSIYNNANADRIQHQEGLQHPMAPNNPAADKLVPHNKWVVRGLQVTAYFLVLVYFIIPAFIKLNPWVMSEVIFLSRVSWPPFINLSNPEDFRLNYTRHFHLEVSDEVTLGVWHVLPKSFHQQDLKEKDFTAALKSGKPIVLYHHGNAGTRGGWHRVQLYKLLAMQDLHVFSIDYRGFGDSIGYPTEEGVVEDSLAVYRYISQHSDRSPIYLWGHSLGSAIATKAAKELCDKEKPLGGLILEAPFNNIIDAVFLHPLSKPFLLLPWFSWAFVEGVTANGISFATDQSIVSVTAPALILHAKDDGIVPYKLGVQLYDTARVGKLKGGVEFASFDGDHGYGHKHLHKAANLASVIREFIDSSSK